MMAEKKEGVFGKIKGALFGVKESEIVNESEIMRAETTYGQDVVTVSMLLGSGKRTSRTRQEIYEKLHFMMGDPIISAALKLHATNALGGDPLTGNRIFIEANPKNGESKEKQKIVDEIKADILDILNSAAFPMAYNAMGFGDAYARPYCKDGVGVVTLYHDEMVWPPLVQSYEQAGKTVGFSVSMGKNFTDRLTVKQLLRMKMPRLGYIAQNGVMQKAMLNSLKDDDVESLPIQPSLVGGTFLINAEEPYDLLQTALNAMSGQRILNSMDESLLTVNATGMTKDGRKDLLASIEKMLKASKQRVADAVKSGIVPATRTINVLPVNDDKQITSVVQFQGASGNQSYTIEDVMTYLKMLTGTLGIDLSMLGFSDLLSGGFGDGGYFRNSAQAAEISQMTRKALSDFCYDVIDLHCFYKYGYTFENRSEAPYVVNFYGSISALENETAATKERSMNAVSIMGQALSGLKDLGFKKDTMKAILTTEMKMDESLAEMIASNMESMPEDDKGFGE